MFAKHFYPPIGRFLFRLFIGPPHTKPESEAETDDK